MDPFRSRRTPLLLLIEDNPGDQRLVREAINASGISCQLTVATDGPRAIELVHGASDDPLAAMGPPPDLILLDLNLPGIDGHEVLARLRAHEHTRHVPVVVMSSSDAPQDISRAYAGGASSFVQKPVEIKEYFAVVARVVGYWMSVNNAPLPPGERLVEWQTIQD